MDIGAILFVAVMMFMYSLVNTLPTKVATRPCTETTTVPGEVMLDCVVGQGQYLDYRDVRDLTRSRSTGEKFNVTIACNGGRTYLPWPFRAANVISLNVTGCTIEGFLAERLVQQVDPDELKYLFISDVTMVVSIGQLYESMLYLNNMTKEFDCGPTNVRTHVFRNVQQRFSPSRDYMTETLLLEKLNSGEAIQTILNAKVVCEYPYMTYLEQSGSRSMSSVHFKLVQENAYPKLRTYSIRNNSLGRIPDELKDLRFSFLPRLQKLDLSHNNIENLDFVVPNGAQRQSVIYIDMRNNAVRDIDAQLVYNLGLSSNTVIDLRNNPLTCSCALYYYGLYLAKLSRSDQSLNQLRDLNCFNSQGVSFNLLDENLRGMMCPSFV